MSNMEDINYNCLRFPRSRKVSKACIAKHIHHDPISKGDEFNLQKYLDLYIYIK